MPRPTLIVRATAPAPRRLTVAGAMLTLANTFVTLMASPVVAQVVNLSGVGAPLTGFRFDGIDANDNLGEQVSGAGDVNGDGLADVIVASENAGGGSGECYVVFGGTQGTPIDLTSLGTPGNALGFRIDGSLGFRPVGASVSGAGDVNGDGLSDVIVGAPSSSPSGVPNAGASLVIFGKTSGATVDTTALVPGQTLGFVIAGAAQADYSGMSVSGAGDVNGDGLADVLVGAHRADPGGRSAAGAAYVVFGRTGHDVVWLSAFGMVGDTNGLRIHGIDANDYAGVSVSGAGDVNGDGLADVILGGRGADPGGDSGAGESYVVFGRTGSADVELSALGIVGDTNGFRIDGVDAGDASGASVSGVGDVNGDGLADVIVGAYQADPPGATSGGESYVVFGKAGNSTVQLSTLNSPGSMVGFQLNGDDASDSSGRSVSGAGDVNGDGLADLVVGARGGDPGGRSGAGETYVVLGRTGDAPLNLSNLGLTNNFDGFRIDGADANDSSGTAVSGSGDVNGDGLADVTVGAWAADPGGAFNAGEAYVVFSPYLFAPLGPPAASGAYKTIVASGNPDRQGIGVHRFGDDGTIFPDSRAWVDFNAGSGPGLASSSEVTTTITRNDSGLTGFNTANTANVQWQFTTNRTGPWTCRATVRYTDAEIAGLAEGSLVLYTAPTAAGPFVPAANFTLTPGRNEAAGEVAALPAVFVLSTVPPGGGILDGDANDDGAVDIADVTAIYNDLAGIASLTPDGVANLANIGGVSVAAADTILDHLANGAPLP